jgi:hypothetical protein
MTIRELKELLDTFGDDSLRVKVDSDGSENFEGILNVTKVTGTRIINIITHPDAD